MTAYRNELDALAARRAALAEEVAAKTRELDDATHLLADARRRASLPVLDNIRIASPCTASWAAMTGDDRVRHCGSCDKDVFNLSAMTRDEAQALITERAGNLCARYFQRSDGTILLADCEVGVSRRRKTRLVAAGAVALLAGGAGLLVSGMRRDHAADPAPSSRTRTTEIMGGIGPRVAPAPTELPPPDHVEVKGEPSFDVRGVPPRPIHDPRR